MGTRRVSWKPEIAPFHYNTRGKLVGPLTAKKRTRQIRLTMDTVRPQPDEFPMHSLRFIPCFTIQPPNPIKKNKQITRNEVSSCRFIRGPGRGEGRGRGGAAHTSIKAPHLAASEWLSDQRGRVQGQATWFTLSRGQASLPVRCCAEGWGMSPLVGWGLPVETDEPATPSNPPPPPPPAGNRFHTW